MMCASVIISACCNHLVVTAGVPILIPDGFSAGPGSLGKSCLLTDNHASSSFFSANLPVYPVDALTPSIVLCVTSRTMRWLSVHQVTNDRHNLISSSANDLALLTTLMQYCFRFVCGSSISSNAFAFATNT